ncbi:hypothetical protein Tco_0339535 [Tanacetum coccineum]
MSGSQDEIPPPPPPPPSSSQTPTQQTPHTVSTIKLPILKKGEYDIWAMKMEHYLAHTDYPIWEVIQNGNGPVSITTDTLGQIKVLPPRIAEEIVARERERKARTTLLKALPEDHLAKFYKMTDAKEMWDAIKSRFGGNDESKKMQKFQSLLSQLEIHGAGECRIKGTQYNRRNAWNSRNKDGSRTGQKEDSKALLWTQTQRGEQLSDACTRNKGLILKVLRKLKHSCCSHQKTTLDEQKIKFMKIVFDVKTVVLTYHKNIISEANKAKRRFKAKVEKWHNSSKNLSKLLNTQRSANDKFGLGYGDHRYDGILSYENEILQSVFMNKESELENQPLYDRFVTTEGMHVVPPPMTGNYMPFGPEIEVDYSQFTYGPKQTQPSESESQSSEFDICESNISALNSSELCLNPVVNKSNARNAILRSGLMLLSLRSMNQILKMSGYGFTERACFVCGSFSHLIRDCDYHGKMAKHDELTKQKISKGNGSGERKPTWNNVQRVNKQNQFVPLAVLSRTDRNPVNTAKASGTNKFSTARQSFNKQTVLTNTVLKVNTDKPIVNEVRPGNVFYKTHSFSSRPFNRTTVLRIDFSKQKVYTAKVKQVSTVEGNGDTADNPHRTLKNKGIVDSGCSRHMTGNKAYLVDFQDFNGGPVSFGGSKGYITSKGKIKTGKLDFEDVSFVKELQHFNLFFVSQMCDKKNKVLFTESECLVLSPDFKLPDENQILLKVPRQNNMYSFNLENIVPLGGRRRCCQEIKQDEEVYVSQTTGFLDPKYPKEGLKVVISSLWVTSKSQSMNLGVVMEFDALRRVRFRCPLVKDGGSQDVDVIFIGSLQKSSHLSAVKRIFRYLKGKPKLGLWYPRVSTFDLESYSDSDYTGANLDRKSTTGGCQFLGQGLIFGDAKKETIVATSTTEAEYVAAANCCGQVLWIQNQMLDYGFNFMNTKIYIDNGKSTFEL